MRSQRLDPPARGGSDLVQEPPAILLERFDEIGSQPAESCHDVGGHNR
jgi:hypothetical protein